MRSGYRFAALLLLFFAAIAACKDEFPDAAVGPSIRYPAHFPPPVYTFAGNDFNRNKFEIGRHLFYDPMLSRDSTISCGTCHIQKAAFADPAHPLAHGIDNLFGTRNAPGIFNLAWHPAFMWDGGINHIEVMPIGPIENPVEMDLNFADAVAKVRRSSRYRLMFEKAWGDSVVDGARVLKAFAQFMGAIRSDKSPYDQYVGQGIPVLNADAIRGMKVFEAKCAGCHAGTLQSDFSYRNNGLDAVPADSGRYRITSDPDDIGKFKVPSLRNLAATPPYMHDGRFESLYEVLNHYETGVKNSPTLDPRMLQGPGGTPGIPLSAQEKKEVLAFLQSLNDRSFFEVSWFGPPN